METKLKKVKKKPLPWPHPGGPLNCTILAVDPGKVSGFSIWREGKPVRSGIANPFIFPRSVEIAFDALLALPGPHAIVVERPFGMKFGTATSGTGAGDVFWREMAKQRKVRIVHRVFPNTWRSKVLPAGWAGIAKRGEIRQEEQRVARTLMLPPMDDDEIVHPDLAPAVCIGEYASYCGELAAKLPKKKMAKYMPKLDL